MQESEIQEKRKRKLEKNREKLYNKIQNILLNYENCEKLSTEVIEKKCQLEIENLNKSYEELGAPFYFQILFKLIENICLKNKIILKENLNKETILFKNAEAELILFLIKYYDMQYNNYDFRIELTLEELNRILEYFSVGKLFSNKLKEFYIYSEYEEKIILKFGNYCNGFFNVNDRLNIEKEISKKIEIERNIRMKALINNIEEKIITSEKKNLEIETKISSFEKSLTKVEKLISSAKNDIDSFHKSVEKVKFDLVAVLGVFVCIFTLISVNVNTTKSFFESEVKFDVVIMLLYSNWVMIFSLGTLVLFIKYILVYSRKENSLLIGLGLWLIMFIGTSLIYYLLKTDFLRIIQHYNFLILNK